jgi:hypothetical protein
MHPTKTADASGVKRRRHHQHDRRLGRHVAHDPRSFAFPARGLEVRTVMHQRLVPIFDQGQLGSCTGNAAAGCMSTAPFGQQLSERDAVDIYCEATRLDDVYGTYPPDDTGSSGLAVMKVLKARGLVAGYGHGFGLKSVLRALQHGPGIVGITWKLDCMRPDAEGVVRWRGIDRGGHEVEVVGCDAERELVWFANSWGEGWGKGGYFAMPWADFERALADDGDAVFPIPPGG